MKDRLKEYYDEETERAHNYALNKQDTSKTKLDEYYDEVVEENKRVKFNVKEQKTWNSLASKNNDEKFEKLKGVIIKQHHSYVGSAVANNYESWDCSNIRALNKIWTPEFEQKIKEIINA